MKVSRIIFLLNIFVLSSCQCDETLTRTCPEPKECYVPYGFENVEDNILTGDYLQTVNTIGECSLGLTACDQEMNLYCEDYVNPEEEYCDGKDNDCDGEIDEGFDEDQDGYTICQGDCDDRDSNVNPSQPEKCDGKDNDCRDGIPTAELLDEDGDGYVACMDCDDLNPSTHPWATEICDLVDNDCNGRIDDQTIEERNECGPPASFGECRRGMAVCEDGELYCQGAIYETQEVCDGKDNDCDLEKDEDLIRECTNSCGFGYEVCNNGEWIDCNAPMPTTEICDGVDNDCNGEIDDTPTGCLCLPDSLELCSTGVVDENDNLLGCGVGIKECDENGQWGLCRWAANFPEECNNYDDNCDGVVDDIERECGDFEHAGKGQCKLGKQTCVEGMWAPCEGNIDPEEEVCDDIDNDCDYLVDEDLNSHEKVDMIFVFDGSGSMCTYRDALLQGVGSYVSDFQATEHMFGIVIFPFEINGDPAIPDIPWLLYSDLTDVGTFIAMLSSIVCDYPGSEPSWDTVYDITDVSNPVGISWREDAHPFLIVLTDEVDGITWRFLSETTVANNTSNCQVGGCSPGDRFEIYVFTRTIYFPFWNQITFDEPERLISIEPPSAVEYENKLRSVFTNVCF